MCKLKLLIIFFAIFSIFSKNTEYCFAVEKNPSSLTGKIDVEAELYQKAEIDLDKNFYQLYRIVERISRANKLDDSSWRVAIPYKVTNYKLVKDKVKSNDSIEEFQAYTQDGNLIVLTPGFMDAFAGDVNILAFVAAHEMAHQTLKHIPKSMKEQELLTERIDELKAEQNEKNYDANADRIILRYLLGYWQSKDLGALNQDDNTEIKNKLEECNIDYFAAYRKREYAADKLALTYMIKAGFDPSAAIRFFEFLNRVSYPYEEKSTHPINKNRIYHVKNELKSLNIPTLKLEGSKNIKQSRPLPYEKAFSSKSIIIHSKYSLDETPNAPFKKMFGK